MGIGVFHPKFLWLIMPSNFHHYTAQHGPGFFETQGLETEQALEMRSEAAAGQLGALKGTFLSHLAGVYCSSTGGFEHSSTTGCALLCQSCPPWVCVVWGKGPRAVFKRTRTRNAI